MHKELEELFNNKLVGIHGNNFQNTMDALFALFYGDNYMPIRQHHDEGNDGCLKDKTRLFAMYAPETTKTITELTNKVQPDYKKYKDNWQPRGYKNFTFIYNPPEINVRTITAKQLKEADMLGIELWSRDYIIKHIIGKLPFEKIRTYAVDYLNIDEEQYKFSIIKWVIRDLSNKEIDRDNIQYASPLDTDEKIKLNFEPVQVNSIKEKIKIFMQDFSKLSDILEDTTTAQILKNEIVSTFDKTDSQQSFRNRIEMMKQILSKKSQDDAYTYYVECIIYYIFEQCLIGDRE